MILARALLHEHHQPEASDGGDVLRMLSTACADLFKWTSSGIEDAAPFLDAAFTCRNRDCRTASNAGPSKLYHLLTYRTDISSDRSVSLCSTGELLLRFALEGDLGEEWRLQRLSQAIAAPEQARTIFASDDLSMIAGSFNRTDAFFDRNFMMCSSSQFVRPLILLHDLIISPRADSSQAEVSLAFVGSSHSIPPLPTSTRPEENPKGTTLHLIDTSSVSGAPWSDDRDGTSPAALYLAPDDL